MTTTKRVITIVGAAALIVLSGAVLYLSFADLSRFRPRLEALVADATGREVRIRGGFELAVLPRLSLVATDITFANASWGAAEPMVTAGRVEVEVSLWSLVSGPIRIKKLELRDVGILLEQNAAGEANWTLSSAAPPAETVEAGQELMPVILELASVSTVEVVLRRPERDDVRVAVAALELRSDPRGAGTVEASGSAGDLPFAIKGAFATAGANGARIELDATVADASLRGSADVRPSRIDFTVATTDLSRVAVLFSEAQGVPAAPLELTGTLLLAADRYELRDATAKLLSAESRLGASLPRIAGDPLEIDISITAPDISELRAELPPLRLVSSAKAVISPERISVDPLSIELGDSDFSGSGAAVLGDVMAIAIKGQSKVID